MPLKLTLIISLLITLTACKNDKQTALDPQETHNQLTAKEIEEGWALLFDGKTMEGWHLYNKPDSTSVWEVIDGTLHCNSKNKTNWHGDLVTDSIFKNYELAFQFKLAENSNSGVFINVQENDSIAATYQTGPEYQLLDSMHVDYPVKTKRAGCLYAYAPQLITTDLKPIGQWNSATIKQQDGKIEFYLDGNLTAKADFTSDSWKDWVQGSGFKAFPKFGKATKGQIALQDWSSDVWFRDMKIKSY